MRHQLFNPNLINPNEDGCVSVVVRLLVVPRARGQPSLSSLRGQQIGTSFGWKLKIRASDSHAGADKLCALQIYVLELPTLTYEYSMLKLNCNNIL
jgi:hypothetical protein